MPSEDERQTKSSMRKISSGCCFSLGFRPVGGAALGEEFSSFLSRNLSSPPTTARGPPVSSLAQGALLRLSETTSHSLKLNGRPESVRVRKTGATGLAKFDERLASDAETVQPASGGDSPRFCTGDVCRPVRGNPKEATGGFADGLLCALLSAVFAKKLRDADAGLRRGASRRASRAGIGIAVFVFVFGAVSKIP